MTASTGINRYTGAPLSDLDHVRQSFVVILSTRIGSRVMRRTFGARVPGLLGRNLVKSTLSAFFIAIMVAVDLWEPRLRIVQVFCPTPPNTPATFRVGDLSFAVLADYRPFALDGDTTTDVQRIWV